MNPVGKEAEKRRRGVSNLKKEKRNFSIGHNRKRKTLTDERLIWWKMEGGG